MIGQYQECSPQNTKFKKKFFFFLFLFLLPSFLPSRTAPKAYRSSQARGRIGTTAASLHTQPQQRRICASSSTYTTAHGNARSFNPLSKIRDQTRILMDTSWTPNPLRMGIRTQNGNSNNGNSNTKILSIFPYFQNLPLPNISSNTNNVPFQYKEENTIACQNLS